MSSLRPKEGGSIAPPPPPRHQEQSLWIPVVLIGAVLAIAYFAYAQYTAKAALEARISALEPLVQKTQQDVKKLEGNSDSLASDINVVSKKVGVTTDELKQSRQEAEKLRQEEDSKLAAAKDQLAKDLATKASTTDVAAVRDEAANKVAEAQKAADTKIGTVSSDVKTVASNLESTRQDLAANRRDLVDVRNTLSEQIAHNASELSDLKKKGERDYFEFDLMKPKKKGDMQRVGDIQMALTNTDTKKNQFDLLIQVDDNKLPKTNLAVNQPVAFLVGRDKLRYEIVVNTVEKDRVRGYLSVPKDKVLSAEHPTFR